MSGAIERVKDRIRKLLAVTKDNAATDGEIENAIAAARNMMHAYHLEEADVHRDDDSGTRMGDGKAVAFGARFTEWEHFLSHFCCDLVGGVAVYYKYDRCWRMSGAVRIPIFVFYGEAESVAVACELFADLQLTIVTMARARHGGYAKGEGRSYAEGFVTGLREKLRVSDEKAKAVSEQSRSLVVQSSALMQEKKEAAKRWLAEVCKITLNRSAGGSRGVHFSHAFSQGRSDGLAQDVSLSRQRKLPAI